MPTTIFNVHGQTERAAIHLSVETDGKYYDRTVTRSKIDTPEKLARWLLDQPVSVRNDDVDFRRRLSVTWHEEQLPDPLTGQLVTIRIIDEVAAAQPGEETAWADLLASPLGAVTLAEANTAVDGISNLAEAKVYFKRLNAVVLAQRDVLARLLEVMKGAGAR